MRLVITGGAGFIGHHVARQWISEGHDVHIIDCLHDYYSPERKSKHLDQIKLVGNYSFYPLNLLDREATIALIANINPDAVIHLAALPGVAYSLAEPNLYVDYDIKATINILEASGKVGVGKFLFASSSSVYGNSAQDGPVKEELANGNVISPYAATKWSAESFCHVYSHLYGMKVMTLRFFTVYGPWGRPDMAIGSFIKKLMNDERIPIYGLNNARDFTYIDDIVNGINLALHLKQEGNHVLNIGNGQPVTMEELLNELRVYFPNMLTDLQERRQGDVFSTWADVTKAKKILNYNPTVSFKEGIYRTVEWAKQYEKRQ